MKKELTATVYVLVNGCEKPFEDLTDDELNLLQKNAKQRLSNSLSTYFSQHPEEYQYV